MDKDGEEVASFVKPSTLPFPSPHKTCYLLPISGAPEHYVCGYEHQMSPRKQVLIMLLGEEADEQNYKDPIIHVNDIPLERERLLKDGWIELEAGEFIDPR